MPNPVPVAVAQSFLGIAKEATAGTIVAPTFYIPYMNSGAHDIVHYLADEALRGSYMKVYGQIAGTTEGEFGWDGNVHSDAIGWPLAGILGDVVTTGVSAPFTHTMAILNNAQPKSYTLTEFYGVTQARSYPFQRFSEVSLKYNAEDLFKYTIKTVGAASTQESAPTETFTALAPKASWVCTATIAGTSSLLVETAELNLKRNASVIHSLSGGQGPVAVFLGPLEVTGKATLIMPNDTELLRYLGGTSFATVLSYTTGASATTEALTATLTGNYYTDGVKNVGKDYVQLDVNLGPAANTSDVGASGGFGTPLIVLENAVAANTYL